MLDARTLRTGTPEHPRTARWLPGQRRERMIGMGALGRPIRNRSADLRAQTAVTPSVGASVIRREEVRKLLGDPRLVSSIPHLVRAQGGVFTDGRLHGTILW